MGNSGTLNICLNKFERSKYSDAGIVEFSFFLIDMYRYHNIEGKYTARHNILNPKVVKFNRFRKEIKDERGSRGEKTGEIYLFLDYMIKKVQEQYNWALSSFDGKKDLKFKEVFYGGLDLFYNISRDNISNQLEYLIKKGEKYTNELGANFKAVFVSLLENFTDLNDGQTEIKNSLSVKIVNKNKARLELTQELTSQYLLFCSENVDDRDLVLRYFKFSIFTKHQRHYAKYRIEGGIVDPNQLLTVANKMKATNRIVIENKSSATLLFGGGDDDISSLTSSISVTPNSTIEILFSAISTSSNTKLKAFNTSQKLKAGYIVKVYHK